VSTLNVKENQKLSQKTDFGSPQKAAGSMTNQGGREYQTRSAGEATARRGKYIGYFEGLI